MKISVIFLFISSFIFAQNFEGLDERVSKRIKSIIDSQDNKAKGYYDLGVLAHKGNKVDLASSFFKKSYELDGQSAQILSWYIFSKGFTHFSTEELAQLTTELRKNILKLHKTYLEKEDELLLDIQSDEQKISELQKDFSRVKEKLIKEANSTRNEDLIKQYDEQLLAINKEIEKINQDIISRVSKIKRPTEFQIAVATDAYLELLNRDPRNSLNHLNRALEVSKILNEFKIRYTKANYNSLAKAEYESAKYQNRVYHRIRKETHSDPLYTKKEQVDAEKERLSALLEKQKVEAQENYEKYQTSPEIKSIERAILSSDSERLNKEKAYDLSLENIRRLETSLRDTKIRFQNESDPQKKEELRITYNDKINDYNNSLDKAESQRLDLNKSIEVLNDLEKSKQEKLNQAYNDFYGPYNTSVAVYNDVIKQANELNVDLTNLERPWKEALWYRDQHQANARNALIVTMNNNRGNQATQTLYDQANQDFEESFDDKKLFTDRPWCNSINYNCGSCRGLAVLGCEFAQMDARSDCQAGRPYRAFMRGTGTGGMIGSCRGVIAVGLMDFFSFEDMYSEFQRSSLFKDYKEYQDYLNLLSQVADQFFNPGANYKNLFNNLLDSLSFDPQTKGLLSNLKDRKKEYTNFSEFYANIIHASKANDPDERKSDLQNAMDKLLGKLAIFTQTGGQSEDLDVHDVERLTNAAKYGAILLDDAKFKVDGTKKFLTAVHGVSALSDGVKNRDAQILMDGLRDTVGELPGMNRNPLSAVLDIPGEIVGSILNVTKQGFEQCSSVLNDVSKAISGDQAALDRAIRGGRQVQNTLSQENYGRSMQKALSNRLIDKVPFARTIAAWFSSDS